MKFKVRSEVITFDESFVLFNQLRQHYTYLADTVQADFIRIYKEEYSSLEHFLSEADDFGVALLEDPVNQAIEIFVQLGLYSLDADTFYDTYCEPYCDWFKCVEELRQVSNLIDDNQQQEQLYRQTRKQARGRFQGGGFGVSGALTGAAKAGAINMATGAMHGMVNAVENLSSAGRAESKKEEVFKSDQTLQHLADEIWHSVACMVYALVDALIAHNIHEVASYSSDEADAKATALLNNLKKGLIPEEKVDEIIHQIIKLSPHDTDIYCTIVVLYGDEHHEIDELVQFLYGKSLQAYKKKLVQQYFEHVSFETEELTKQAKVELLAYGQYLGVEIEAKYLACVEEQLVMHDEKIRTVDTILFKTREEAKAAKRDVSQIHDLVLNVDQTSEAELVRAKDNVVALTLTHECLREKYLDRLSNQLTVVIRLDDEKRLASEFDETTITDEQTINQVIAHLKQSNIRSEDLVLEKLEALEKRQRVIIEQQDRQIIEKLMATALFLKQAHVDQMIEQIANSGIRTESLKAGKIAELTDQAAKLIERDCLKVEKARRYEQRKQEATTPTVKKGFMSKLKSSFENIMGVEEDEKAAWEAVTCYGMRTIEELDL